MGASGNPPPYQWRRFERLEPPDGFHDRLLSSLGLDARCRLIPILRVFPGSSLPWRGDAHQPQGFLLMRGHGCRHIHGVLPFKSVAGETPAATMAVG
jgi:hypothetical protein